MEETLINEFYRYEIIQHGDFTLKNGEKSNFYIDCRKIFQYPNLMRTVCDEINMVIQIVNVFFIQITIM